MWLVSHISDADRLVAMGFSKVKNWHAKNPWEFHDTMYEYSAYEIELESCIDEICSEMEEYEFTLSDLKKVMSYEELEKRYFDYLDRGYEIWNERVAIDTLEDLWRKA